MKETPVIVDPCPFCGETRAYIHHDGDDRVTAAVVCGSCAAQGPWVKVGESGGDAACQEATRRWNRREQERIVKEPYVSGYPKPYVSVYPNEDPPDEVIDEYLLAFNIADALDHCAKQGFVEHKDIEEIRYPNKAAGSFRVKANGVRYVVQVRVEKTEKGPKR